MQMLRRGIDLFAIYIGGHAIINPVATRIGSYLKLAAVIRGNLTVGTVHSFPAIFTSSFSYLYSCCSNNYCVEKFISIMCKVMTLTYL